MSADPVDGALDILAQTNLTEEQRRRMITIAVVNGRHDLYQTSAEAHTFIDGQASVLMAAADLLWPAWEALVARFKDLAKRAAEDQP